MSQLLRCSGMSLWMIMAASLLVEQSTVRAADPLRPVAVLSIASVDRLMGDFTYLTSRGGRAGVSGYIQLLGASLLQNLDRTRPLGMLITIEDDVPKGVGFLPVLNLDKVLAVVRDKFNAPIDELGDGITKVQLGKGAYLKQQGAYLFFSDQPQHLDQLPADPVAVLDGLHTQYDVAVRFYVQHVPSNLRDLAVLALHHEVDVAVQNSEQDDPEIDGPFLELLAREAKASLNVLINQSEQLTVGWGVDSQGGRMHLDLQATAVAGSALAQQWSRLSDGRSLLSGCIVENAAVTFQGVTQRSAGSGGGTQAVVEYLRQKALKGIGQDPQAPEALRSIVNNVLDVVARTIEKGRSEISGSVVLAPKSFQFVAGVCVADGRALAVSFQELYALARQQPDMPEVKFFADTHHEVDLHTLTIPIAERDVDAHRMLGEKLDVVVGTGPQSLYFAFGPQCDTLLKTAIDRSVEAGAQPVPPVQVRSAARPLMMFLASLDPTRDKPARMAEAIHSARGGDEVSLTVTPCPNGFDCRLLVEEGILEMLGKTDRTSEDGF